MHRHASSAALNDACKSNSMISTPVLKRRHTTCTQDMRLLPLPLASTLEQKAIDSLNTDNTAHTITPRRKGRAITVVLMCFESRTSICHRRTQAKEQWGRWKDATSNRARPTRAQSHTHAVSHTHKASLHTSPCTLALSTVLSTASVLSPRLTGPNTVTLRANKRSMSASMAVAGRPVARRCSTSVPRMPCGSNGIHMGGIWVRHVRRRVQMYDHTRSQLR
jgi:hypothetical protein